MDISLTTYLLYVYSRLVAFFRLKNEFKHGRLYIHAFQEDFMLQNQLDKLEAVSGGAALALTRLEGDLLHYKVLSKALIWGRLISNGGRIKRVKYIIRRRYLTGVTRILFETSTGTF